MLIARDLTMTGTMRKNKPEIPSEMLPNNDRPVASSLFGFQTNATMVSYVPKKNKSVILLSTFHNTPEVSEEGHRKPRIILDYNSGKCGVDTLDQLVRTYTCARKCNRWPMALFFNLLNVASYNALVLFLEIHPEYELTSGQRRRKFLLRLGNSLIGEEDLSQKIPVHLPENTCKQKPKKH